MLLRCQVQLLEWLALLPDDTTAPSLEGFELDMDSGNLTLSFDEAVQISTFNLAGIDICHPEIELHLMNLLSHHMYSRSLDNLQLLTWMQLIMNITQAS